MKPLAALKAFTFASIAAAALVFPYLAIFAVVGYYYFSEPTEI